ncbi:MAG: DUF6427 family protein [Marinifilaceae bacterium]
MLLKMLKGKNPILIFFVPVVGLLLWLNAFIHPEPVASGDFHMPLYQLLIHVFQGSALGLSILAFLLLLATAFGLNQLNEKYIFIKQRTDLPAFLFILLTTGTIVFHGMHPAIPAGGLMVLAMNRFLGVYRGSATISRTFDTGIIVGLATLFYFHTFPFLIWIWLGLIVMSCFQWREFIVGLFGFLTPLFFAFGWYFWNDRLPELGNIITYNLLGEDRVFHLSDWQLYFWGFLGVVVLFSSFFMLKVYEEKRTSSRKYFTLILWYFIFNVATFFLFPATGLDIYFLAAIPITYLVSHYFELQRHRWMGEVVFTILLLSCFVIQFFG